MSLAAEQDMAQLVVAAIRARLAAVPARPDVRFADLEEAGEGALRDVGGRCLEAVVAEVGTGYRGAQPPWACGARQETDHYVSATWQTVRGDVRGRRVASRCPSGGAQAIPLDEPLGLPTDRTSPLLRARLSRFCAVASVAAACPLLEEASGVQVSAKRAQLVSEELGARLEAHQAATPPGETDPAGARGDIGIEGVFDCTTERDAQPALLWREAKVGGIAFPLPAGAPGTGRHRHLAPDGRPIDVLDPASVSDIVPMGDWRGFADKLWREAERRGIARVREIVLLRDGAEWIETVRALLFAGLGVRVVHILDLRHAAEHLGAVARLCVGEGAAGWIEGPREDLREGRADALLAALRQLPTPTADAAKLVATTCTYFDERRAMRDYPRFRAAGYHIGSGIAESACKRLVSQREKGPGMHWTTPGAQAIATWRAAHLSTRWDEAIKVARAA